MLSVTQNTLLLIVTIHCRAMAAARTRGGGGYQTLVTRGVFRLVRYQNIRETEVLLWVQKQVTKTLNNTFLKG